MSSDRDIHTHEHTRTHVIYMSAVVTWRTLCAGSTTLRYVNKENLRVLGDAAETFSQPLAKPIKQQGVVVAAEVEENK